MENKKVPFKDSMWINVKRKDKSHMTRELLDKAMRCFGWVIDKKSIHFNPGSETDRGFDGSRNFSVQAFFTVTKIEESKDMKTYQKYLSEGDKYDVSIRKGIKGLKLKTFNSETDAMEFAKAYIPKLKFLQILSVEEVGKKYTKNIFEYEKED